MRHCKFLKEDRSLSPDFIVVFPRTKDGHYFITIWLDRLSRKGHFIKYEGTYMADNFVDSFFENIFKHHGLRDRMVSDRDSKLRYAVWKWLIKRSRVEMKIS